MVGIGYALAGRSTIRFNDDLTFSCTGARFAPKGGQTIGNAFVTRSGSVSARVHEHEARHSTQYTWFFGSPTLFGLAYAGASLGSALLHRLRGPRRPATGGVCDDRWAAYNMFEMDADLDKGGYLRHRHDA